MLISWILKQKDNNNKKKKKNKYIMENKLSSYFCTWESLRCTLILMSLYYEAYQTNQEPYFLSLAVSLKT